MSSIGFRKLSGENLVKIIWCKIRKLYPIVCPHIPRQKHLSLMQPVSFLLYSFFTYSFEHCASIDNPVFKKLLTKVMSKNSIKKTFRFTDLRLIWAHEAAEIYGQAPSQGMPI